MQFPALHGTDGYKLDHRRQYPANTVTVYSNLTPRKTRIPGIDKIVVAGTNFVIKDYIIREWNETFFSKPKNVVVQQYKRRINNYLGPNTITLEHIEALHDLGYLPLKIKALKEGTTVKMGVPILTITNELPEFYWLPNFLETVLSADLWPIMTAATIAFQYRVILDYWAILTTGSNAFSKTFQGHNFSARGTYGRYAAVYADCGHLFSFTGTDTIWGVDFMEEFYNANSDKELVAGSVPATEHSVMCMGTKDDEIGTFLRLLDLYPTEVLSVVSDTWDLWNVCTVILPKLKTKIMLRGTWIRKSTGVAFTPIVKYDKDYNEIEAYFEAPDGSKWSLESIQGDEDVVHTPGKLVIRPDSGDPADILCGVREQPALDPRDVIENRGIDRNTPQYKGVVRLLWEVFGGTTTEQGYKLLDSHIGAIYGDSITLDRAENICQRLADNGFASVNVVFGIGSYTYQYVTRDTFGFAMKATYGELSVPIKIQEREGEFYITHEDGKEELMEGLTNEDKEMIRLNIPEFESGELYGIEVREIFKDPITDDGTKRSAKGLLVVYKDENGDYYLKDQVTSVEEEDGFLEILYENSELVVDPTLADIRAIIDEGVNKLVQIRLAS